MISRELMAMMGIEVRVMRGYTEKKQFRFPRSKKKRIRIKWAKISENFKEIFHPPPMKDDEFIVINSNASDFTVGQYFNPKCKDASQSIAGKQMICCTAAGEATLLREMGLIA